MFTKIDQSDLEARGATTLPDKPTMSTAEIKAEFDAPAKEIIAPAINNLIDELDATSAADNIGHAPITDWTGDTAQEILDEICEAEITDEMLEDLFE